MTNMQVAAIAGTLALLVLPLFVMAWRLQSEVRRLAAEVTSLGLVHGYQPLAEAGRDGGDSKGRKRAQRRPESPTGPDRRPAPVTEDGAPVIPTASAAEPVPVITGLAEDRPTKTAEPSTARIASVTLGPPLIKIAAFSHGVRRALGDEQRMRVSYAVRKELRRQHKLRRRRRRSAMAPEGGRP